MWGSKEEREMQKQVILQGEESGSAEKREERTGIGNREGTQEWREEGKRQGNEEEGKVERPTQRVLTEWEL